MSGENSTVLDRQLTEGRLASEQERYDKARVSLEAALAEARSTGVRDHRLCEIFDLLSTIYANQYRSKDAKHCVEEAARYACEFFGENSLSAVPYLERFARQLSGSRNDEESKEIFERCLAIKEAEFGADHIEVARTLRAWIIAENLWEGNNPESGPRYARALLIMNAALSADDSEMIELLEHFVSYLRYLNKTELIEKTINRHISKIIEQNGKPATVVKLRLMLAETYDRIGRYNDNLIDQITSEIQSLKPIPASELWLKLGMLYQHHKNRDDKALEAYLEALNLIEKELGAEHVLLVDALERLDFHGLCDRKFDALPYTQRLVNILEKVKGSGHPSTLRALVSLAGLYALAKADEKSEELFQLVVLRCKQYPCNDHSVLSNALATLALGCAKRKEYAQADAYLEECEALLKPLVLNLDENERVGGFLATQLLRVFTQRSRNYKSMGDLEAAALEQEKLDAIKPGMTWANLIAIYKR